MPIEREEVERVARLARLEIDAEEADRLAQDLERIVAYIDRLQEVEVSPDADTLSYFDADVHREDRVAPGLEREDALWNAPASDGASIVVPQIVSREGGDAPGDTG